jgi:hypothetical protein
MGTIKIVARATAALALLGSSAAWAADIGGAQDFYYSPPTSAPTPGNPFGDLTLSATFLANDLTDDDWAVNIGGVFVFPMANGWSVSVEGDSSYLFEAEDWHAAATGNLFYVAPTWAAGVFATAATDDIYVLGGEAALFVGNLDIVGELGYVFADSDAIAAALGLFYYLDPNTYVGLEVASTWFDDDGGDFQQASVGIEHLFAGTPFTGFIDAGWDNAGGDNWQVTVGSRLLFGGPATLRDYFRANPF